MAKFKLTPYKIHIYNNNLEVDLNKIPTKKGLSTLFEITKNFCTQYSTFASEIKDRSKTFCFDEKITADNNKKRIFGFIKSGDYGLTTDFWDIEKKKRKRKARKSKHSEEIPFFFLFQQKSDKSAHLILMNYHQYGVKYSFTNKFNEYLAKNTKGAYSQINPLISDKLIKKLLTSSKISKIILRKKELPKDIADKIRIENPKEVSETIFLSAKKEGGIQFKGHDIIEEIKKRTWNYTESYYEIAGQQFEDISIVLDNQSQSTISLNKMEAKEKWVLKSAEENLENTGFPKKKYLLEEAEKYLKELIKGYA